MEENRKKLYAECKVKLLKKRQDVLSGLAALNGALSEQVTGDEADMAQTFMEQNSSLVQRDRMNGLLREIDMALERIEGEEYGICEETEEPIEKDRLLAMPWTRFSLQGAEIREAQRKKFA